MSWDADLYKACGECGRTECAGQWGYTHNCNGMANAVLYDNYDESLTVAEEVLGIGRGRPAQTWWKDLDGKKGSEGAAFLARIIRGLEADPRRFVAMAPPNEWGSYSGLLNVLKEMLYASIENPEFEWGVRG